MVVIPPSALMLPGPSERTLSINEEELEGSFRKWNAANKGPEELFKPEVLRFIHDVGFQQALGAHTELGGGSNQVPVRSKS